MVKIMVNHPGKVSPKRTLVNFTMVGVLEIFVLSVSVSVCGNRERDTAKIELPTGGGVGRAVGLPGQGGVGGARGRRRGSATPLSTPSSTLATPSGYGLFPSPVRRNLRGGVDDPVA